MLCFSGAIENVFEALEFATCTERFHAVFLYVCLFLRGRARDCLRSSKIGLNPPIESPIKIPRPLDFDLFRLHMACYFVFAQA